VHEGRMRRKEYIQKFSGEACLIDHLKDGDNGGKIKTDLRKTVSWLQVALDRAQLHCIRGDEATDCAVADLLVSCRPVC
jgi:hypothetical protein